MFRVVKNVTSAFLLNIVTTSQHLSSTCFKFEDYIEPFSLQKYRCDVEALGQYTQEGSVMKLLKWKVSPQQGSRSE